MVSIEQLEDNDNNDYTLIDTICFRCEHAWKEHYEKGCLHVINKYECRHFDVNIKYCACLEPVNRDRKINVVFR